MNNINFDMDGTIANLYSVNNWFPRLRNEDATPYIEAKPMLNMKELTQLCQLLQKYGLNVNIISWLSKEATADYKQAIRKAKKQWLAEHFPIEFNHIHLVQYGTNKRNVQGGRNDILFDDNPIVLSAWEGRKADRIGVSCAKDNEYVIMSALWQLLNEVTR